MKHLFQIIFLTSLTCFESQLIASDFPPSNVFEAATNGYKVFRIPAIIAAPNGDLLAFSEARQGNDAGETDLVLKRSSDHGKTWGALELVQESDDFRSLFDPEKIPPITIGNPAPVVDMLDPKIPGRIWLPFTLENDRVFVTYSDDSGKTWAKRREITADVKRESWGWYATGPVHSIQIQKGPHRGRLVVPCDHRIGQGGKDHGVNGAHLIYSDNGGETWGIGAVDDTYDDGLNANETTVVELNDGSLYFNTRDQNGKAPGTRGEAWSRDGGKTFESRDSEWKQFCPVGGALDTPVVQSALLCFNQDVILFSGPDENGPSGKGRSDLRIRISIDEAKTWHDGPLVHTGPAAYSDMVVISKTELGVLFEAGTKGAYDSIRFAIVDPRQPIMKIACIGDSITFGHGIKDRALTYPAQLQNILGDGFEVRNFGNSGRSVLKKSMRGKEKRAFLFMKEHQDALAFQPDIVISNLGINDLMDYDKFGDEFIEDYRELLKAYQSLDSKPRIIVWTPLAPLFAGHAFFGDSRIKKINQAITRVAKEMDIEIIDMESSLRSEEKLFPDKIHPNAEAAGIIARQTAAFLRDKLVMSDPARQPKRRSEVTWRHLKKFYGNKEIP